MTPTELPPTEPPTPEPGPAPRPASKGVHRVALELYRTINKLDKWGGGGFGLSTVVKIAGWAGLIAVLATLVVKLRTVEQQLDPVSNGVRQLRAELQAARDGVGVQAQKSQAALRALTTHVAALDDAVTQGSQVAARAHGRLEGSDSRSAALQAQLDAELAQAKALADRATAVGATVDALSAELTTSRSGIQKSATSAQAALGQVQGDLGQVHQRAQALADALTVASTQATLSKIEVDASALDAALQRSTHHAEALDALLAQRIAAETARAAAAKAGPKQPK